MLLYHILNDAADALRALDELTAEALVGLPLVTLAEVGGTVGVGHRAHDAVANAHQHQCVEDKIVHNGCVGDLGFAKPF